MVFGGITAEAKTQYVRIIGAGDSGAEIPSSFSILTAYEPSDGYGLILHHDLFQADETVIIDSIADLTRIGIYGGSGDTLTIMGGLGILDKVDPDTGDETRQFYRVTTAPTTLAIPEPYQLSPPVRIRSPTNTAGQLRAILAKIRSSKRAKKK
jgi:hypothetical protein